MKVFKFGGASTNSYDRIKNLASILKNYEGEKLLIVISAMGKITNGLEKVAEAFYEEREEDSLRLFQKIKNYHLNELKYLNCPSMAFMYSTNSPASLFRPGASKRTDSVSNCNN